MGALYVNAMFFFHSGIFLHYLIKVSFTLSKNTFTFFVALASLNLRQFCFNHFEAYKEEKGGNFRGISGKKKK